MDARNTGALIAARRKALGLTQKQLAERLLVSDKAVSKWEVGASYPEVTLLPPLAQILGLTVDELLAGEVRGEESPSEDTAEAAASQDAPPGHLRVYAAEKLAEADDKLLLGGVILLLPLVYWVQLFGYMTTAALMISVLCIVLFCACIVWHGRQRAQVVALCQVDAARSLRRSRLLTAVFGGIGCTALLRSLTAVLVISGIYPGTGTIDAWSSRRFDVSFASGRAIAGESMNATVKQVYSLLPVVMFSLLIVLAVVAYRRMDVQTRLHPGLCVVPTVLAWALAVVTLVCRVRMAYALEPAEYGESLLNIRQPLAEQAEQLASQFGLVWAAAVLVAVVLAAALRRRTGAGGAAAALCMAMQAILWYFATVSGYLVEIDVDKTLFDLYARGEISIYRSEFFRVLLLSLLIWGMCTLLSSLRRKKA